jgi:hypothetical protein
MNRFSCIAITFVLITVLAGCASVSKAPDKASEKAKEFSVPKDRGSVFLYRKGSAIGAALQYMVKVNGIDAGGTGPGTFFRWDLKPGTYTALSSSTESSATVQVTVEAGKMYFFEQIGRLGLTQGGRISINEVDEETGMDAVSGLKLLVSAYVPE